MQARVAQILNIGGKIKPDDAADGLAIALTHAFTLSANPCP
jgi:Holliday junction resolvasome RuvABC endonuclease subunit